MAENHNPQLHSDDFIKDLALLMTVNCVRDTVIEDYHGRGSLSQKDMKRFNKEVSNKIYTFLHYLIAGSPEERDAILKTAGLFYPRDWDKPKFDTSIKKGVEYLLDNNGELPPNILFGSK